MPADVQVIGGLFHGAALTAKSAGPDVAVVLRGGAKKFLIVDFETPQSEGFFNSPIWSDAAGWAANPPLHGAKRGSTAAKEYPCMGKAKLGDVLLLRTEGAGDIALAWTGKSFKTCQIPGDEP